MNIYQRLQKVMQAVAYVQKDTQVNDAGGYKAVSHDMVTALVRPHFLANGIVIHPTLCDGRTEPTGKATSRGTPIVRYVGVYDVAFVNVDEPADRCIVHIEAHAEDTGDKAPGKCISYACKAAVLKVLMLETGENDESRVAPEAPPLTEAQEQVLAGLRAASLNGVDALEAAWKAAGKDNRKALADQLESLKYAAAQAANG